MTATHKGRILIVEDHDMTRQSLAYILEQAGHSVTRAARGEEALGLLRDGEAGPGFDVVLSDLLLNDITGIDVLRAARGLADPPEVILLTGYGTLNSVIEALRTGACDYLLKPTTPAALLASLQAALERRHEHQQQQRAISAIAASLQQLRGYGAALPAGPPASERYLRAGRLEIDQVAHVVTFAGQEVALTPTEYAILHMLAGAANTLVTYQALVREIYSQDLSAVEAHQLLKTHMHNLRQKIAHSYIVNVRGAGYRLRPPDGE